MFTESHALISPETIADDLSDYVDDLLIDKIWRDLHKQITHEQIRQVALEIAAEFQEATIPTFVPIFIHRLTIERLSNQQ